MGVSDSPVGPLWKEEPLMEKPPFPSCVETFLGRLEGSPFPTPPPFGSDYRGDALTA